MKKKSALFLLLIGGTMLSGCIGNPKLEEDTIGEIISEKDPVYDYLQGYVDNVSLVKEKDDGDSKTVWVKTTTEFDNFTYVLFQRNMIIRELGCLKMQNIVFI